jgi:tape measure domain-containing protein
VSETYRIDIVASPRQAVVAVQSVENSLERLNKTAASTNGLLKNALQIAGIGSGVVLVQRLASNLIELSDSYTQVQNRLGSVTKGTEELEQVTSRLLEVANGSRASFEATAQLYARTALATKDLGTSQADLLGITETVNKAIILSGASAKESSNGLIQLSQAISSNRLAGDELRSVLEQLPVVADVIAKQLGVTRGQLRELGRDGKITADVILDGFRNAGAEIREKFAKSVPTAAQSIQLLRNNATVFVGELNKATNASAIFAQSLKIIGDNIDLLLPLGGTALAIFAAGPVIKYAQSLRTAALEQQKFNQFRTAAIGIADASLAAAKAEDVVLVQSSIARTEAQLAAVRSQQAQALATREATEATFAQLSATLRSSAADIRKAQSSIAVAEAELLRAQAEGVAAQNETFLFGIQQELAALETFRAGAVQRLALAETELAAASSAAARAQQGRVAATVELRALEAQLAAQTAALAAAQRNANVQLEAAPTLLARISAAISANPFGAAAAGIGLLLVALVDVQQLTDTFRNGIKGLGDGLASVRGVLSGVATGLGVTSGTLQVVIRLTIAATAAFAAFKIAAASAGGAAALGIGAALLALGELTRALDEYQTRLEAIGKSTASNATIERLERTQARIKDLNKLLAVDPSNTTALEQRAKAQEKLVELERAYARERNAKRDEDPLAKEIAEQENLIRMLGLSARERAIELDLIRRRNALAKEGVALDEGSKQEATVRDLLQRVRAAEELAAVVEDAKGPYADLIRQQVQLRAAFDDGRISADQFSSAMNRLSAQSRAASPLTDLTLQLREDIRILRESSQSAPTAGESGQLEALRAAQREAEIQAEIRAQTERLRASGVSEQELAGTNGTRAIELLVRQRAELERLLPLQEQLAELRQSRADENALAFLPEFDQGIERQLQALRELNEVITDPAAEAAAVRRNALMQEFGGVLNSLQSPLLAQQQSQQLVAAQIERANEAFAQGVLNGQQFALVMEDLDFKARSASTTFADGFTVALDQMVASINGATVGNQLLTSSINAATSATSQFVQQGSVDWRKLALNIIDSIAQIITQLLVLRAIKAIAGIGGSIPGAPAGDVIGPQLPGLAEGGPANKGQPYIVGERGPELFVPGRSGTVIPNDQVAESFARAGNGQSSAPVVVPAPQVNVAITNVTDPNEVLDALDSPAGERRIVNAISRNPTAVRRGLGT